MIGTAAQTVIHTSSNLWYVLHALVIVGGIAACLAVIGAFVWIYFREDRDRPILPWGARMGVERERAYAEREKQRLERDALEIKRMALEHQRTQVLSAIQNDDHEKVAALGLPAGNGKVEDGQWSAVR